MTPRNTLFAALVVVAIMLAGCGDDGEVEVAGPRATDTAAGEPEAEVLPELEPLGPGEEIGVGETRIAHEVTTHCGLQFLFVDIDGRQWTVAGDDDLRIDWIPEPWEPAVDGQSIDLRIERIKPDRLEVAAIGTDHTLTYVPSSEPMGCD